MANLQDIAAAVAADFTREQIVAWRQAAIQAIMAELPRVEITGANFDSGGSQGQFVSGRPERVLEICNAALAILDGPASTTTNKSMLSGDFSRRAVSW